MVTVYLTSGPRGTGKSIFVEEIIKRFKEVCLVSRDKISIELFGSTSFDPYCGGGYEVIEELFYRIKKLIRLSNKRADIIVDCWNGFPSERVAITRRLREVGVDRVICWQFIVPEDTCVKWFFQKNDSKGYSESGIRSDYALYYKTAKDIEKEGFDQVYRIDPCLPLNPDALGLTLKKKKAR